MLLQLAAALAPSLDLEATSLLYRSAKPLVLDDSAPQLQKRAYKVRLDVVAAQGSKEGGFSIFALTLPACLRAPTAESAIAQASIACIPA